MEANDKLYTPAALPPQQIAEDIWVSIWTNINLVTFREWNLSCPTYRQSIHSFIHQWLYSPLLGPGLYLIFVIFFTQTVGLLGRVLSPSQGRYLHTGQLKHRVKAHTDIHASSGIRIHDPSVLASEGSSCPRPRAYCDRVSDNINIIINKLNTAVSSPNNFNSWWWLHWSKNVVINFKVNNF
jgi:hypothetical protein